MLKHHCDYCGCQIYELNEEVSIIILETPNDMIFFCSDSCMWDFVKDNSTYAYVNDQGAILRDGE